MGDNGETELYKHEGGKKEKNKLQRGVIPETVED